MRKFKPGYLIGVLILLAAAALCFGLLGRLGQPLSLAVEEASAGAVTPDELEQATAVATGQTLGIISLVPVILTVALAFITKEVLFSLFMGMLSALVVLVGVQGPTGFTSGIGAVFTGACQSVLNTVTDSFHAAIIILCIAIGGMVAVINAAGGFGALGKRLTRGINSPKRAALMAQALGMCLFFDDYANSLITGPVMRGITDKHGVSREKLAYIVDSTAAPVAGIAVISSWIAAELSAIESGFAITGIEASAYSYFWSSIPYCFYNFVAIALVLATALLGREYGPMLLAERRARAGEPLKRGKHEDPDAPQEIEPVKVGSLWNATIPVGTMIVYSFVGFYLSGMANAVADGAVAAGSGFSLATISTAFGCADTVGVLMQASILASLVAIFMGCCTRQITIVRGIENWLEGASGILLTVTILVLAWSLSALIGELGTAYFLVEIITGTLPYWLLPMLVFITCCVISFAAGSFGCMVIVMPIAVPVAFQAAAVAGVANGRGLVLACIASVLSGSIFGDHCSPVTDTTILSSLGAGCNNLDHVKTQLPYALTTAGVTVLLGYLPAGLGAPPVLLVVLSIVAGVLVVRFAGKKVQEAGSS